MPSYSFRCPNSHGYVEWAPFSDQWAACPVHGVPGPRDFHADFTTQTVVCDDPIRRAYNGAKIDHNLAEQGRPLDPLAPRDRFEAKHIEKATGRVYIGDNAEVLSDKGRKAVLGS